MSLNFTVQKIEEGFPDGQYPARLDHMEYAYGDEKQGDHPVVRWTFLSPAPFEGETLQKKYFVNHENPITRKIAIQEFSKLCVEIGGFKEGDEAKEKDFLYKEMILSLRKNKNGYTNIVGHTLVETNTMPQSTVLPGSSHDAKKTAAILALAGIEIPTTPVASTQPLNDEVPF